MKKEHRLARNKQGKDFTLICITAKVHLFSTDSAVLQCKKSNLITIF